MKRPSGAKRGSRTLRSSGWVRGRGVPPSTETTATWLAPYQRSCGSPPCTKAIQRPSGLKAGLSSRAGELATARGTSPARARTTKTFRSTVRSGSGSVRLLTNAIHSPSGDQVGDESSNGPAVRATLVFFATSNTWTWPYWSFR